MSTGAKVAIGAGVVALGAGAYYLLGPNAKAHQKKASALMVKIKKEAENKVKKVKNATASMYHKAVDSVSASYCKQYEMHEKEIKAFAKKLKSEWRGATKLAKKSVKKATKKVGKNLKKRKA